MKLTITLEVEIEHVSGKFVTKDEIREQIIEWVDGCNEDTVYVEESEYEIRAWEVE